MPVVKKLYKWTPNDDMEKKGYNSMFFVGEDDNESGWLDGFEYAEPTPLEWVRQNGKLVRVVEMPEEVFGAISALVDGLLYLTEPEEEALRVWRDKIRGVDGANANAT